VNIVPDDVGLPKSGGTEARRPLTIVRSRQIGNEGLRPQAAKIFVHRLKGSNTGEHQLVRDEARALRAWLKVRGSFPGPIFLSKQKRNRPNHTPSVDEEVRRRCRYPDAPPAFSCTEALLRHSLIEQGVRRGRVQDWIGHANIQSTMEYAKVTNARRDDMAQQLKETWR